MTKQPTVRKLCALLLAACHIGAQAAPTLPQVAAGQASFSQNGNVFSITNTPGTIINWQGFNVGAGEITRFIQQGSDSAVLNRVLGQDPSRILGALQSNGKVFLINPNGILFGQGARVDVNGLVASTLNMSDADFLAGKKAFQAGATAGALRNEGSIATPSGGKVYLVAPDVENRGLVTAPNGEVVLAAGRSVQLVESSDPDLHVVLSAPQDQAVNLGQVIARGGRIGIFGALVAQRGLVNADSAVRGANGKIVLKSTRSTTLSEDSVTSAAASGAADGGAVVVWSDGATVARGAISVAAAGSGKGGFVETSGHVLDIGGLRVDARAASGRNGSWLLDPYDIEVRSGASGEGLVDPATLVASGADIVLQADHDITVSSAINANAGVRLTAGNDITVNAPVASRDGDLDFRAGNAFTLGANGALKSDGYIDISANQVALKGAIGKAATLTPVLTLSSADAARPIVVGSDAADKDVLWLDAAELARASGGVYEINLGNSRHTGAVSIAADLALASNLVLESAGNIYLDAAVDLHANPDSRFIASLYGANGLIRVSAPLRAAKSVLLQGDRIAIESTVAVDDGGVTLMPNNAATAMSVGGVGREDGFSISQNMLARIQAASLSIGGMDGASGGLTINGPVDLSAAPVPKLVLDAGAGALQVHDTVTLPGTLVLKSDAGIVSEDAGRLDVGALALRGGDVALPGDNHIGVLAAGTAGSQFRLVTTGPLRIGSVDGLDGVAALQADVYISSTGSMALERDIAAASIRLEGAGIAGGGTLRAPDLWLSSSAGIGTASVALKTQTTTLSAFSYGEGADPINIANQGALRLNRAVQYGSGNGGAITIDNVGAMTLPASSCSDCGDGIVFTSSGDIRLVTHSPLTIEGQVTTDSGNIHLEAGNSGLLTVSAGALVKSGSGDVNLVAGSTSIAGGTISVSSPDKLHVTTDADPPVTPPVDPTPPTSPPVDPTPPTPPTLSTCIATPAASGCAPVLAQAVQSCVANSAQSFCGAVLPTLASCQANPSTAGCSVVIERHELELCVANPQLAGCAAKLPTYAACLANPATFGCVPVLARAEFDACLANPGAPGCAAILPALSVCKSTPSLEGCSQVLALGFQACLATPQDPSCSGILPSVAQCVADSSRAGCQVVLPTLAQCTTTPSAAGCSAVLPSLGQCVATPTAAGCSAVLPGLSQCTATPSAAGCTVVLPSLGQCVAAPSAAGCSAVLPSLNQCVAAPSAAGCSVVLPSLGQCVATPTAAGCSAVLPSLNQCTTTPSAGGCSAVLPSLSQCVADSGRAGCVAVLPTLAQCVGSPTLQGCTVRLPTLAQCAATPSAPGCTAVLPSSGFCATHPGDASCVAFGGNGGASAGGAGLPVAQAAQAAVQLINTTIPGLSGVPVASTASQGGASAGAGGASGGKSAGPEQVQQTGVLNAKPSIKTYCN